MDDTDDRIAQLIAAAAAGELTPEEAAELDALRRIHPGIDEEIASLSALVARLDAAEVAWSDVAPDAALRDRITVGIAADERTAFEPASVPPSVPATAPTALSRRRSSRWVRGVLGAAACIAIGVGVGLVAPPLLSPSPPSGPPGTLGAVENIDVRDEADGTAIDADLVAHTWGTEAVLDATGLDVGATYSIVFVGIDGSEFSAGEMLGSPVEIHCRVNAAVLREDVARLEIRDASGASVAVADVPNV